MRQEAQSAADMRERRTEICIQRRQDAREGPRSREREREREKERELVGLFMTYVHDYIDIHTYSSVNVSSE